jgi:hypothetical protein
MTAVSCFFRIGVSAKGAVSLQQSDAVAADAQPFMLDDHSKVDPLLPIPNRTVKRLRADDSGWTSVKVGHRQAPYANPRKTKGLAGVFLCTTQTATSAVRR